MWELSCQDCETAQLYDAEEAIGLLQRVGLLRREKNPGPDLIESLLASQVDQLACPNCRNVGLSLAHGETSDDGDWETAVLCEICNKPVPPERVEAIPDVQRCVACQGAHERGDTSPDEFDYCPKCGAIMELRVSRGSGLTRFRRFCTGAPPCRLN